MFFPCDNFKKTSEITLKSLEIMVRGRKSQLSVEEIACHCTQEWSVWCVCGNYKLHLDIPNCNFKLEQLERLRSEDTPRRLMITHTIGSQVKKIIDLELKTLQSRHDFQSQGQMTLKI